MRLESKVKLNVRGKVFGGEKNLACIPMIPATREALIEETKMVVELKPDVIEWRVDYFEKAADAEYVKESLEAIAPYVEEIPVIFTFRHACEGGAKEYPQDVRLATIKAALSTGHADIVDIEACNDKEFIEAVKDKPYSYHAFQILYWCGLRVGELLALTSQDIDFDNKVIRITKSYQRLEGKDVITDPKTPKSKRNVSMPDFLCEELKDYIGRLYGILPTDRIFHLTKSFLHHEMTRGAEKAGVKRIRIHDLRHSHVSLLISMGFSAVSIGNRVGHESVDITYRYAHMFPTEQTQMAKLLNEEFKEGAEE